jgi:esterase/lipase superfamily enzyme
MHVETRRTMKPCTLYFATNRNHVGADRWKPKGYGKDFSDDGRENLRFGRLEVAADEVIIARHAAADMGTIGKGDGERLAAYFTKLMPGASITAFRERLNAATPDEKQAPDRFGSDKFFWDLQDRMLHSTDVVVFVHGYNVSWEDAAGSALALQEMLNRKDVGDAKQSVAVVLFTWPSDGSMFPYRAYNADRADARDSGYAVGRALLKLRDYLIRLREAAHRKEAELCQQDVHLLCHSKGNFVLENALARIIQFTPGVVLPRVLGHIFLCAADVDDTVLDDGAPMGRLHELAETVTVYFNRDDKALLISDLTKSNPTRLGTSGAAHPFRLHNKVHQVDCTPVATGLVQHSYFLSGNVNKDIRLSIDGLPPDATQRPRQSTGELPDLWRMK